MIEKAVTSLGFGSFFFNQSGNGSALNAEFHPTGPSLSHQLLPWRPLWDWTKLGGSAGVTRPAAQLATPGLVQQAEHEVPPKHLDPMSSVETQSVTGAFLFIFLVNCSKISQVVLRVPVSFFGSGSHFI